MGILLYSYPVKKPPEGYELYTIVVKGAIAGLPKDPISIAYRYQMEAYRKAIEKLSKKNEVYRHAVLVHVACVMDIYPNHTDFTYYYKIALPETYQAVSLAEAIGNLIVLFLILLGFIFAILVLVSVSKPARETFRGLEHMFIALSICGSLLALSPLVSAIASRISVKSVGRK